MMTQGFETVSYFFSRYRWPYFLILIMSLVVALFESFNIAVMLPFLNLFLVNGTQPADQGNLSVVINKVLDIIPLQNRFLSATVLIVTAVILKSILKLLNELLIAKVSSAVLYNTKKEIMGKYSDAPYSYFLSQRHGTLMYYVTAATPALAQLLYRISRLCAELFKIAAIIVLLLLVNIYIALVLFVFAAGLSIAIGLIARNISYKLGKERIDINTSQSNILNEFIVGIKQIRVYKSSKRWLELLNKYNRKWCDLYVKDLFCLSVPGEMMEIASMALMLGIILFMKLRSGANPAYYVPFIGIFGMAILRILPSARNIGRDRMVVLGLLPDAEVIYRLLHTDIKEARRGAKDFINFKSSLIFENVTFSYNNKKNILQNLNMVFDKNKFTAIVGASGAGKTTIINLLLGFYNPDSGRILIDGTDIYEYKQDSLFNKIVLVSQDVFIFHSTIAENISLGQLGYTYGEIRNAAKIANADGFIMRMDEEYDTIVGERGMKLSGGQQQRIALARAIIRKPEVLILDEATSALDSLSEKAFQEALNNVSKLCTLIVIAHRLSTVRRADKIFVLKDGSIKEEGSHEELISQDSHYTQLYRE